MNRFEQRKQKRLLNPEIAEGYLEMSSELYSAMGITADITLHQSQEGEVPLFIASEIG